MTLTEYVTHHEGETLEDTYRRSDGDEFGYQIPAALIEQLEAAEAARAAAVEAVRAYITDNDVPEVDIETGEVAEERT